MSCKLKLVGSFLPVSVLPLGAAGLALHSIAKSSESRRGDVGLEAGMRAGLAAYKGQLAAAGHRATSLAGDRDLQTALLTNDRPTLRKIVAANRGVRLGTAALPGGPAPLVAPRAR